ncbi:hypothetical protein ACFE04_008597 [Oxalis oulophora]
MNVNEEEQQQQIVFEIALVVPKNNNNIDDDDDEFHCVKVVVDELRKEGLIVDIVKGHTDHFIKDMPLIMFTLESAKMFSWRLKVESSEHKFAKLNLDMFSKTDISLLYALELLAAPLEILGKAAAKMQMQKATYIGMDLLFEWEELDAFVRQPDGALFSWSERYQCYHHLIYGIVNKSKTCITLNCDGKKLQWEVGESLVLKLESEDIITQVFPLHDENKRKQLLKIWALNWWEFTVQPIDEIYSYFGMKIAVYFTFLGMYTRWLLFPAGFGLILQLVDFGSMQLLVLPVFFMCVIFWAVLFFQFWKRKNAALLARWQVNYPVGDTQDNKFLGMEWASLQSPLELIKILGPDHQSKEKEAYQRYEWFGHLRRFRNDSVVLLSIIFLQLPFELTYAHFYEVLGSDVTKFALTAVYLFAIQYFTHVGGRVSVKLIKCENNDNSEHKADSLVYKVFGLYFMQTYIGIFYHALLHRNFETLRMVLIQRLVISEVLENLMENSLPYLKYNYKKYRIRKKTRRESGSSFGKFQFSTRVEKEYLKPRYSASIAEELEDGLFDDFLELALQFGMIMMFACAFPPAFGFAAVNNIMEIRTDALKLLTMFRRPIPRDARTIGAWLNIFQFLIVMSICTNSVLLVCLYDREGKWKIEPGLAAILIMEHVLLLIKFGFSRFVPEEPAWVRANRMKNVSQAQGVCSRNLLRSISGEVSLNGLRRSSVDNDFFNAINIVKQEQEAKTEADSPIKLKKS